MRKIVKRLDFTGFVCYNYFVIRMRKVSELPRVLARKTEIAYE